jgi:hypothetical protein
MASSSSHILAYMPSVLRYSVAWFLVACSSIGPVFGEGDRVVTLSDRVHFNGDVQRVLMAVSGSRGTLETKSITWIEQPDAQDITCIGRVILPPDELVLNILFVVLGQKGEVRSSYRTVLVPELSPTQFFSSEQLRDRFIERRSALRHLQSDVSSQDVRLTALQQDADAIANVSKIVSAEDELEEVKAKLKKLDAAFKSIEQRSLRMKTMQAPLNLQNRESELVRQLGELSTALVVTENNALKRIKAASVEMKQKLQMIEESKEEHIVLLEDELAELQRKKK